MISCKQQEIFRKRLSNGVPKSESKLGKCRFGASGGTSGGTSGASGRFFTQQNVAKVLQKWSQACKSDSKRHPKVVKVGAR